MSLRNIVLVLAGAAALVVIVLQRAALNRAQADIARLQQQLAAVPEPAPAPVVPAADLSSAEHTELLRLRGEVSQLRRERDELARRAAAQTNATGRLARPTAEGVPDRAWVTQMLNAPAAQQGALAGAVRAKLLRGGEGLTASELALHDALAQRDMNALEKTPTEFAAFQSAFIESAVGLTDSEKTRQIHDIILKTYEHAVGNGLDVPSKPAEGADGWVTQRHQLDRRATSAVQNLLTPEERQAFDRAFLGVMGVDLGTGVDKSNYPPGFLGGPGSPP
jgi:hypothetical protein